MRHDVKEQYYNLKERNKRANGVEKLVKIRMGIPEEKEWDHIGVAGGTTKLMEFEENRALFLSSG